MDSTVAEILHFDGPCANVEILDRTVNAFYGASSNEEVRGLLDVLALLDFTNRMLARYLRPGFPNCGCFMCDCGCMWLNETKR